MVESIKKFSLSLPETPDLQKSGTVSSSTPATVDPQELLVSLQQKQKLYRIMHEEGLIHSDRFATIQNELQKAIADLSELIPLLEETKDVG